MTSTARTGAARMSGARAEGPRRRRARLLLLPTLGLLAGCSMDGLLKSDEFPPDVADPAISDTPAGALIAYRGTLVWLRAAYAGGGAGNGPMNAVVSITGRLTDELDRGTGGTLAPDVVDQRTLLAIGGTDPTIRTVHSRLQLTRNQAGQAIGLLTRHVPENPALAAHMYAVQAYSAIFLAELFCSGIPLSTVDFDGDYTLQPGSTTTEVFNYALARLDTGLTLAGDSARFLNLVRVGQGRARLALGQYAAAAAAVAAVPDTFRYAVGYSNTVGLGVEDAQNFLSEFRELDGGRMSVSDLEGGTGLDFRTSADPRTSVTERQVSVVGGVRTVFRPTKYRLDGTSAIALASGIEARLIEAEALLQAKDYTAWLDKLNHLRRTAYPTIVTCTGTTCTPATSPLSDLADPGPDGSGTDALRVDLMFRERAFWLFLTGHRQGDLRRLLRQYGPQFPDKYTRDKVYPSGSYPGGGFYGSDVVAPIPASEQGLNPLYTGCVSVGA